MWYLLQELVFFFLFYGDLSCSMKRQMIQSLKRIGDEKPPKRVLIHQHIIASSNLNYFVTSTSKLLFQKLKLPSGFLQKDPNAWNDHNDFFRASSIMPELKVVNDHAERGVALIQEYCGPKNKQQLQLLLTLQLLPIRWPSGIERLLLDR